MLGISYAIPVPRSVIARSVSDVAISITFPVILRERSDRRISVVLDV